jgi:predicted Zn-dependent protease
VVSAVAAAVAVAFAWPLGGYYFETRVAWNGPVTMQLQLGPSEPLIDGSADWNQSAVEALEIWNQYLKSPVQFGFVRNSTVAIKRNDKNNNVFFGDDVFGEPFAAGTAAVTLLRWSGNRMLDADVVFNRAFAYNSYRGPSQGQVLDFRRVALHEFGHVLGLNHPDVAGQAVDAIMNSTVSDTDVPQADDVQGVESLYGTVEARSIGSRVMAMASGAEHGGMIGFPALDEVATFSGELEAAFRDELKRPAMVSFVDVESVARWTQEYVRYRVQACGHQDAVQRTFMQMDGLGIQPVCGAAHGVALPQRDELFDFRSQLEAKFRDDLKAYATTMFAGAPADAAWVQEYLRYRLGACGHDEATGRVLDQVRGRGAAPICR